MTNYLSVSYILYTTIIIRTLAVFVSPNWLTAWIILEINILRFIPLITATKTNQETEAATKYFLAQALGSLILLLGSSIIYQPGIAKPILWLLLLALLIKLGAAPCHFWYPSVIASLSWESCLILSTWQKLAPLILINGLPSYDGEIINHTYINVLLLIAVINTTIGGVIGINQTHLRSLLAYSSIGHMGWIISGLAINITCLTLAYFTIYSLLVVPIFILLIIVNSKTIHRLHNIFKTRVLITLIFTVLIISLAGLPPLRGFFPKILIIWWLANTNHVAVLLILAGSYINLYYYLNIRIATIISSYNWRQKSHSVTIYIIPIVLASTSILGILIPQGFKIFI